MMLAACIGVMTAAGSGIIAQSAEAAALCVGTASGCYSTIQAAVDAAHGGDSIAIGPGTYAGGVTIDVSVRLAGAGPATRISGGGPVVTIGSATSKPTVTIANVTITGGVTTTDPQSPRCGPDVPTCGPGYTTATALGGGVEAFPGTKVTILNSIVTANRAVPATSVPSVKAICPGNVPCPASFGDAAGINDWGTMTLIGTIVSDNHAAANQSDGGGIAVEAGASLSLRASAVTGNSASAAPPTGRFAAGGGVYVDSGGYARHRRQQDRREHGEHRQHAAEPVPPAGRRDGPGKRVHRRRLPCRWLGCDDPRLRVRRELGPGEHAARAGLRR